MPLVYDHSLSLEQSSTQHHYFILKRLTDIMLSVLILMVLGPCLIVIAVMIKMESPGPVIFRQWRYGYHGQKFLIYKFRTLHQDQSAVTGGLQVTNQDRRLTRLGHYLRSKSIDELPQLWNVLKGDMALVGPRPHALDHHDYYVALIPHYERRLDALPGLTGLAQITGCRGATPELQHMQARFELDRLYVTRQSYRLDMKILYLSFRRRAWRTNSCRK